MKYSINENTKTAKDGSTWIGPGIHENLELVGVKAEISKTGKPYLAFYVENEHGDKVSDTEWPMNFSMPLEQMPEDKQKRATAAFDNQMSKIRQIVDIFKPGLIIETESFEELANAVVRHLGDSYKGIKFRLKVVFDDRGYATFAQKGLVENPFIEPMTVSKEDSRIRILPFDQMERPAKRDEEKVEINPVIDEADAPKADAPVGSMGNDDLPF